MAFLVVCSLAANLSAKFFRKEVSLTTEVSAMGSLLKQLNLVGTAVMGYVGDICSTIVEQPVLLLTIGS